MNERDQDITKFSYISYRALKKTMGEYDAVVECNELAVREFAQKQREDPSGLRLEELSKKHKIEVHSVDLDLFESRIRQYYILTVMQQSEQFLERFKSEWKRYFPESIWERRRDGETLLECVLRNTKVTLDETVIEIYDYYRLIRNYMAHTGRDIDQIRKKQNLLEQSELAALKKMHVKATPNALDAVNYDDFFIATNIVKHIAYKLCMGSKPSNFKIAEFLFAEANKDDRRAIMGLKKLKADAARYESALEKFSETHCGRLSSGDLAEVMQVFKRLLD